MKSRLLMFAPEHRSGSSQHWGRGGAREAGSPDRRYNATLERRIAAALADDITSTDLAVLITETEAAISEADRRLRALEGARPRT